MNHCTEVSTYVPALAYTFSRASPVEIEVTHAERTLGSSKYLALSADPTQFDLMTGFGGAAAVFFSMAGGFIALISLSWWWCCSSAA